MAKPIIILAAILIIIAGHLIKKWNTSKDSQSTSKREASAIKVKLFPVYDIDRIESATYRHRVSTSQDDKRDKR